MTRIARVRAIVGAAAIVIVRTTVDIGVPVLVMQPQVVERSA